MSTQVTCSACSTTFNAKAEWENEGVKCPNCHVPILIPSVTANSEDSSAMSRWLVLGAISLISLGVAGGFVFGHRQGKSDERRELAHAQSLAQSVSEKLKASEAKSSELSATGMVSSSADKLLALAMCIKS